MTKLQYVSPFIPTARAGFDCYCTILTSLAWRSKVARRYLFMGMILYVILSGQFHLACRFNPHQLSLINVTLIYQQY